MRFLKWGLMVSVMIAILAACSSDSGGDSGDSFADLVSTDGDVLDERSVIEEAFVKQKDLLKLGFLTGEETLNQTLIQYNPADDELDYTARVDVTGDRDELSLDIQVNDDAEPLSYEYDTITNETAIDVAGLDAVVGDYNDYNALLATGDRVAYSVTHFSEAIDMDVMKLIGQSLKTEEQGAFELLYDQMKLDFDAIHFPNFDAEKVSIENVAVNHIGDKGTTVSVSYTTENRDDFTFMVRDYMHDNGDLESSNQETLDAGVAVDLIEDGNQNRYQWIDGDYFYEISYSPERSPADSDDIYAMVGSAVNDARTFTSLAFLENSAARDLTDVDRQLQAMLGENSAAVVAEQEAEREQSLEDQRLEQLEIDKQEVPEEYPDHLRLGDSHRWQRSDAIGKTDVETTVNSFEIVDEINGVEPEEGVFLVVNITIEDLLGGSTFYTESFLRGLAYDSSGATFRRYELDNGYDALGDYDEKFPEEFTGPITGNVVFDIEPSNYYRVDILDGNWLLFEDEKSNEGE